MKSPAALRWRTPKNLSRPTIGFLANTEGELISVRHIESPLKQTIYDNEEGQYSSQLMTRDTEPRASTIGMTIDSLFLAGDDAGLSAGIIMELAAILGGVIDFALDPEWARRYPDCLSGKFSRWSEIL